MPEGFERGDWNAITNLRQKTVRGVIHEENVAKRELFAEDPEVFNDEAVARDAAELAVEDALDELPVGVDVVHEQPGVGELGGREHADGEVLAHLAEELDDVGPHVEAQQGGLVGRRDVDGLVVHSFGPIFRAVD